MVKAITAEDVTMSQEVDAELVPHVLLGVPLLVGQDVLRLVGVRALHVRRPHLYTQLTVSPHLYIQSSLFTSAVHTCTHS